jgi:two-component system nitrogen regulation response regulator GlnG
MILAQERTVSKDAGFKPVFRTPGKKKPLVFLVDDDPFFLLITAGALRNAFGEKVEVKTFENTGACLKAVAKMPDLVILDYFFAPGEPDGLAALKEINHFYPQVPVIIASAQERVDLAVGALREGASDYLKKDEKTCERLKVAVAALLDAQREEEEEEKEMKKQLRDYIVIIVFILLLFTISRLSR